MATMTRIPVSLPKPLRDKLTALRVEGYSVSGYLKHLAELDIQAREEAGWRAGKGWNTPQHRQYRKDVKEMLTPGGVARVVKRRRAA